jgi:hypothetical protein
MVVLTALKNDVQDNENIGGLGKHELKVGASRYAVANSSDFTEYKFDKDGIELIRFDKSFMNNPTILAIREISASLPRKHPAPANDFTDVNAVFTPDEHKTMQHAVDILSGIIENWYKGCYPEERNIVVLSSRNMVPRAAGSDNVSSVIPGNPMMHLDYFDFHDAYKAQCNLTRQAEWNKLLIDRDLSEYVVAVNNCETYGYDNLLDVVNIWFPTSLVQDWPLTFMPDVHEENFTQIEIISGSVASSVRLEKVPLEANIVYKEDMDLGEAYLFRSASDTREASKKKSVLHGSIRISNKNYIRRSFECRFMVFRDKTASGMRGGNRRR